MKNLVFLLGLFFVNGLFAQNVVGERDDTDTICRTNVDKPAVYCNGWEKFAEALQEDISTKYTGKECKRRKDIQMVVLLKISSTGELVNVEIHQSDCEILNPIVIESVKKLEKFKPAIYKGEAVGSSLMIPIVFPK